MAEKSRVISSCLPNLSQLLCLCFVIIIVKVKAGAETGPENSLDYHIDCMQLNIYCIGLRTQNVMHSVHTLRHKNSVQLGLYLAWRSLRFYGVCTTFLWRLYFIERELSVQELSDLA